MVRVTTLATTCIFGFSLLTTGVADAGPVDHSHKLGIKAFGWCDTMDPAQWPDPETISSTHTINGALVELRYSPSTQCAWGRLTGGAQFAQVTAYRVRDAVVTQHIGSSGYTPALDDAGTQIQVCGKDDYRDQNGADSRCTATF